MLRSNRTKLAIGTGILVTVAVAVIVSNQSGAPDLSELDLEHTFGTLRYTEIDPNYLGETVCDGYRTEIAYLSECLTMFEKGTDGPCEARAAPEGITIPASAAGLSERISDLNSRKDLHCNKPFNPGGLVVQVREQP